MVGISAELDLEIRKMISKLGQADARVGRFAAEGARKGDRFARGFEGAVTRGANRSGGAIARFFSGFRGAARAAVGIGAITAALVILSRRFPVIGQVASKTFRTLLDGAKGAAVATSNIARAMGNLRTAATVAVGVAALARAYRALRGSGGGDVKVPRLPSTPSGAGGGIMGQVFGGTLLGGLASRGIGNLMDGARNAVAGAVEQIKNSFSKAADMEQVQISFGVMLGSEGAATSMLDELKRRAANTPFEMPSLTDAAQKLLQFDVAAQDILPTLDMLGDISGGNAQKLDSLALAFGQMASTGRLMGGELLQMINAGFNPLQEISKRTGKDIKTLKKEMEMGDIDADLVIQAFRDATSEGGRFYGMMAKQSKSAVGLMSTLRDAWGMNLLAFGQPVMESIKPLLEDAINLVEIMRGKAIEMGEKLAVGIDFVRAAFQELSGGELLTFAGDGLKLAFKEAVNILARGIQTVFKVAQDSEFMGELETRIEQFGAKLKAALLSAIAAAFEAMKDIPGVGKHLETAAYGMKNAAFNALRDQREAEKNRRKRPALDLSERMKEQWKNSRNLFETEADWKAFKATSRKIENRAARNKADRLNSNTDPTGAPGDQAKTSSGPIRFATGGAGAVQNQVNALFGRPMEAVASATLAATQKVARTQEETNRILRENFKAKPPAVPGTATGVFGYG